MDKDLEFEYDMANLALKGKRFKEAESKFLGIARQSNNSLAWCGVGLSKFGLIIDNEATIPEVFYCFNKAKTVDNESVNQVEDFVLQNSFEIIKTLFGYLIQAHNLQAEASKQKMLGVANFVFSSFMGAGSGVYSNKSSLYSDLTALGGTAMGYSNFANGKLKQLEAAELKTKINSLITETRDAVREFVISQVEKRKEFDEAVQKLYTDVIGQLSPETQAPKKLLETQKPDNAFKKCSASEQFYVEVPRNIAYENVLATIKRIGSVKYDNYEEGLIKGKSRYFLQSVSIQILVMGIEDAKAFIQVGADGDDAWGTGARKVIQKFKDNFALKISY